MIPYREDGVIKYAPASAPQIPTEDSDFVMPLIYDESGIDEDGRDDPYEHFTATGKPLEPRKVNNFFATGMGVGAPQYLQERYTDESIIPVIVTGVILSASSPPSKTKYSFLDKLKLDKGGPDPTTKVIFAPRGEYLKYFARDSNGVYIGTEPQRRWTEQELEEGYSKYKKDLRQRAHTGSVNC